MYRKKAKKKSDKKPGGQPWDIRCISVN
nr:hypothetical protein [Rickettsia endosymbiont of Ceutorhynchus assimilis]